MLNLILRVSIFISTTLLVILVGLHVASASGSQLPEQKQNSCEKKACDEGVTKEQRQCVLKKYCKTKTVTVEKVVEKPVEKVVEVVKRRKNHLAIVAGIGPKGNINAEQDVTGAISYEANNGAVVGLQYLREIKSYDKMSIDGALQIQSNRTFLIGVGVGF